MIDRNRYESLADALASVDDLKSVADALARERIIRQVMAETGEAREIITQMIDAGHAMSEEAVLELTEGEPTTLRDALERYVGELAKWDGVASRTRVASDLNALLGHRWPEDGYKPADETLDLPELPPKWSAPLSPVRIEERPEKPLASEWDGPTCGEQCRHERPPDEEPIPLAAVRIEEHRSGALIFDVD